MVTINDLIGIPENKRKEIITCLDDLLIPKSGKNSIIKGYNWYTEIPNTNRIITFSNIHETETYKEDMLKDLEKIGYDPKELKRFIRNKGGAFLHGLKFRIHDDNGKALHGLKIKNVKTGNYLDLTKFSKPLINYLEFKDGETPLIAEDNGWEIDLPFKDKEELMKLISLFLRKAGLKSYSLLGEEIKTEENAWRDAYETPVLLLGEKALNYKTELPSFIQATKMYLKENSNEISFVINKNLELLKNLSNYSELMKFGFREEKCLGNKSFIVQYVDKEK